MATNGSGRPSNAPVPAMVDLRGLAVHEPGGRHHLGAVGLADALVAQADTEDRHLAGQLRDHVQADAGVSRADPGRAR